MDAAKLGPEKLSAVLANAEPKVGAVASGASLAGLGGHDGKTFTTTRAWNLKPGTRFGVSGELKTEGSLSAVTFSGFGPLLRDSASLASFDRATGFLLGDSRSAKIVSWKGKVELNADDIISACGLIQMSEFANGLTSFESAVESTLRESGEENWFKGTVAEEYRALKPSDRLNFLSAIQANEFASVNSTLLSSIGSKLKSIVAFRPMLKALYWKIIPKVGDIAPGESIPSAYKRGLSELQFGETSSIRLEFGAQQISQESKGWQASNRTVELFAVPIIPGSSGLKELTVGEAWPSWFPAVDTLGTSKVQRLESRVLNFGAR